MNTEKLKWLAEPLAAPNGADSNASWWDAFHRAANPSAILDMIAEVESLRDQVNGLTGSLDHAEKALKESRANDMAAMSWLADCRIASGDHGKRMLPEFVEYLRIMKQQRDELLAEMRVIEDILNRETNTQDMGYELFRRTNFIRRAIETTERKS